MRPEEALGASKKYTNDSLKGIGALKGANCTIVSIVNDDVNKESVVVYAWLDDTGVSHTDTMKVPYGKDGVSIASVRVSDDRDYFIFTNSEGVDLEPVPLPDKLVVKISKEEGNALVEKEDGIYVSITGVKISETEGNQLKTKEDGLYVPETALSEAEGNILERKEDGIYASADKIAISEKANNTLSLEEDGLYVPETAISDESGNVLERKEDGMYVPDVSISETEGNKLEKKNDGLFVSGVSISEDVANQLEERDDGLYVPETDISEAEGNILERKKGGLYVPSLEVNVSNLSDASKLLNIKVGDTVDQSVVIPCKTTVLSANVQQFGSADSIELYKYADGVSIYSQSLIDTDSDGVVVYDQNLRRFGNVKVNDDGLTFTLIGHESEFTFNINPSLVAETVKLHDEGFNIVLYEANEDYGVYIDINDVVSDITREEFDTLAEKVAEIELFKFPNAVIKGEPVVNNGQISGFSSSNYLVLPSVFDLAGRGFEFKFAFTTSDDVTLAQNILGSKYCMAFYIKDSKLSLRVSSNGTSWDIVNLDGDYAIEANKTYYVKVAFDRLGYKLSISLDDITYDEIGTVTTGDISPKPSELYLGIGNNFNNPFRGILNLNKCYLKVNTSIVWQGMDDAGLATRLATDLENIDEFGIARVKEIAETDDIKAKIAELELFKFPNATIHGVPTINNGQISGFSANNYLAFPFLVDFGERNFVIDMAFTTGSDVTNQQNIIDGKFGLALAIKNGKFVLAISTNGESWDLGAKEGTYTVLPDTNYYLRLSFDHSEYKLSYSLNRESYVDDITVTSSVSPYPVKILIGIGDLDTANPKPFGGIINMNYCYLTINDTVVWRGMDDAGLSTRLSVDLANIDAAGIAKVNDIMKDSLNGKLDLDLNNISDDGVSTLNEKIKVDPDTTNTIIKKDNGLFSQKEVINITRENYDKLTPEQKALDVIYNVYDEGISDGVVINDNADPAPNILYSSKKVVDTNNTKVNIQQSVDDAGKVLTIGEDGRIIAKENVDTSVIEQRISDNWQGTGYNLIPYPYFHPSRVNNGVTFTVNEDGTVLVDGTATANAFLDFVEPKTFKVKKGTYKILSGEASEGFLVIWNIDTNKQYNELSGVFTFEEDATCSLYIYIRSGTTISNALFYPMLVKVNEDGSYPTEYQRYALGNVELTDTKADNKIVSDNWNGTGYNLIPYPYRDKSGSTHRGMTFTYDSDGVVTVDGKPNNPNPSTMSCIDYYYLVPGTYALIPNSKNKYIGGSVYLYDGKSSTQKYSGGYSGLNKNSTTQDVYIFTTQNGSQAIPGNLYDMPRVFTIDKEAYAQIHYRSLTSAFTEDNYTDTGTLMLVKVNEDGSYPTEYQRYALGNVKLTNELDTKVDIHQSIDDAGKVLAIGEDGNVTTKELGGGGGTVCLYLPNLVLDDGGFYEIILYKDKENTEPIKHVGEFLNFMSNYGLNNNILIKATYGSTAALPLEFGLIFRYCSMRVGDYSTRYHYFDFVATRMEGNSMKFIVLTIEVDSDATYDSIDVISAQIFVRQAF